MGAKFFVMSPNSLDLKDMILDKLGNFDHSAQWTKTVLFEEYLILILKNVICVATINAAKVL